MKSQHICSRRYQYQALALFFLFVFQVTVKAQFNFTPSGLTGAVLTNPTSLQFGPDGRLYVSQQNGIIKVFTVVRNAANNYSVKATETISLINQIPNHNDDGTLNTSVTTRQITGILVAGTASQPLLYVTSSDSRIGGGSSGSDVNLDTNSGIISLLTWNGSAWVKIDLVRGLPRSEENHSPNGMQLDPSTNTLYVAIGGITNAGSPSNNFGYTCEYALSAAIISVDLNTITSMATQGSGNTAYKYDLPTVDDPTRTNSGSADVNDPFGGNDGLNQARIVADGPVKIFSPGYRNAYDLVITKTPGMAGRIYTIDNGANPGWGGYPENEGTPNVTNNYVSGEPGSTGPSATEAQVNDLDGLHYIGTLGSYVPGSYYGGHPNPIRANPSGAGLYTRSGTTGVFRTQTSGTNPLPADWPPVPQANPIEGDFQMPGSSASKTLLTFTSSTNGLAEYTASNFNNALKGNLLAAAYDGAIYRIRLSADGTSVLNSKLDSNKVNQDPPFASGFGSNPLDLVAQGDNDVFPGTVWAVTYGSNSVTIFEPTDMGACTGLHNNLDDDGDGYTNADEMDNGTDPCSAASKPPDFDHDFISDLNDPDDDNDGIADSLDVFPIDVNNGLATSMPINYELLNNNPGTGFFGLGFTGLMSNKQTNYLKQYDPNNLVAGGAVGAFTVTAVSPKDALGTLNNQENGFQFGVRAGTTTFTIKARMLGPFFNNKTPVNNQSQGIYIGTGDQSNYLKITLNANGGQGGVQVVNENADVPVSSQFSITGGIPASTMDLYLTVNPATGVIQPKYSSDGGTITNAGAPIQVSGPLLNALQSAGVIAVGIISTSINATPFTATWDYIYVTPDSTNTTWVTVAPSAIPKWVGFSVMINNKMYVFSGFDNPQVETTPKVEIYDPATNTWTFGTDMPLPVTHAGITVDGNKVYVAGGFVDGQSGGANTEKVQVYDAGTNTWSSGPDLPQKCGGNALVRVGRKLHSFGGLLEDRQTGNPAHYVLDLNNVAAGWTRAADAPLPRCHFASACVAGKIYTFGGQAGHDVSFTDVKYVHVYDPSTDVWTRLNDMPYSRSHSEPATFVMEGKVYLVGGRANSVFTQVLDKVTFYDPATDTWTEDTPLPVTLFGPAAEAIGSELIVSNGSLGQCCAPQTTTRKRGITRTPNLKIGFLPSTLPLSVASGNSVSKNVILWTLSGNPNYSISTSGLPSWLSVSPTSGTIDLLGGTEITITANAATLGAGNYTTTVTAKSSGYPDAVLNISLSVTASNNKVLYLYGSVPPAQVDMKLSDGGSSGMSLFKQALIDVGLNPSEALDSSITLNAATLNQYKVLILGSNNRRFTAAEQAAVSTWVNAGGGIVAWSDGAFGWTDGGVNSSEGSLSDNDLMQQFGMQFLHDNGAQSFTYNQWAVDHYINKFNKNAGITIKAEGVSAVRTSAPATIIGAMPPGMALNSLDGPVTAADAALSVAKVGQGRAAGYFDRNAFWNAGAGTNITEVDNKTFAQRLILWVSGVNDAPPPPPSSNVVYRINAGGPQLTTSRGVFAADQYYSPSPGFTFSTTTAIAGTTDGALYQTERSSTTDQGTFSYSFPVSNGTYTVVLHFAEIYQTAVNKRVFDVSIENVKVLDNYDIYKKVGAFTATTETFTTTVSDGMLDIYFSALASDGGINRPKVSAIEILSTTTSGNTPPTANAGADQTITLPTSSVTLNGSGTDPDGTIASYAWTKISGPTGGTFGSPSAASTTVSGLTQGTYTFRLTVTDNLGATGIDDVVIIVNSSTGTNVVYRINSGGPQLTTSIGVFAADQYYSPSPGFTYSTTHAIAGTTDDALYQNERGSTVYPGTFSYAFPVTNGTYTVILHFCELYQTAVNKRVFDVSIENVKVLDNYDIYKKVGNFTATTETFTTTVNDGMLDIYFSSLTADGGINRPEVTAIEILSNSTTTNVPPTANAGQDQIITLPTNSVQLNGSGTDTDGSIASYAWSQVSGPSGSSFTSPSSASTSVNGLVQGSYVFRLTVTDNKGATGSDDVNVTVNPSTSNTPPTANAGQDQTITLPTNSVTLNGSGSDPGGSIASYAWTTVSGPAGSSFGSPSSATTTVTGLVQGTYTFRLTVTDNQGATGSDDVVVTVNPSTGSNAVYRINAGGPQLSTSRGVFAADQYYSPSPGFTFSTTTAIAGTTDGALYQTERSSTTDQGTFSYAFPVSNGTYTVILHFAEIYQTAINKRVFDVSIENVKVLDNYDIYKKVGAFTATTETFTTTVSDGMLDIYFSALATDGGINRPKVSAIEILSTTTSGNTPPTANAGQDQSITLPTSSVTFNGSGSDIDGTITSYAWSKVSGPSGSSFGTPSAASTTVTGLVQGFYTFRLTVTDNQGATASDDVLVTVSAATGSNVVYRINSGGPQLTTSIGVFAADQYYSPSPGFTYSTTHAIAGTTDDALYQNERGSTVYPGTFSYAFPVSNGTYTVILHFCELYQTAVNKRVFDVSIENVKVLDNYDIYKKVGNYTATTETFTTTVNDGMLDIYFSSLTADGGINRPEVTAIEILNNSIATSAFGTNGPAIQQPASDYGSRIYPNPTIDGRVKVQLPGAMQGDITYILSSVSGVELIKGKLTLVRPTPVLEFNFSLPMQKAGTYYLRINNKGREMVYKLVRIVE